MKIGFWSPFDGHSGNTSNLLSTAIWSSLKYDLHVLIADANSNSPFSMHSYLGMSLNSASYQSNTYGLDMLQIISKSGGLTKDDFIGNSFNLTDKIDVISGTNSTYENLVGKDGIDMINIVESANTFYDLVFVDIHSGTDYKSIRNLINFCDILVVSLPPVQSCLDEVKKINDAGLLQPGKVFYAVGRCDTGLKVSSKHIKRFLNDQTLRVFDINYSTNLANRFSEGQALKFFYGIQAVKAGDLDFNFKFNLDSFVGQLLGETELIDVIPEMKQAKLKQYISNLFRR